MFESVFFPGVNYWKSTVDGVDKNEYLWVQEPKASHLNSWFVIFIAVAHNLIIIVKFVCHVGKPVSLI